MACAYFMGRNWQIITLKVTSVPLFYLPSISMCTSFANEEIQSDWLHKKCLWRFGNRSDEAQLLSFKELLSLLKLLFQLIELKDQHQRHFPTRLNEKSKLSNCAKLEKLEKMWTGPNSEGRERKDRKKRFCIRKIANQHRSIKKAQKHSTTKKVDCDRKIKTFVSVSNACLMSLMGKGVCKRYQLRCLLNPGLICMEKFKAKHQATRDPFGVLLGYLSHTPCYEWSFFARNLTKYVQFTSYVDVLTGWYFCKTIDIWYFGKKSKENLHSKYVQEKNLGLFSKPNKNTFYILSKPKSIHDKPAASLVGIMHTRCRHLNVNVFVEIG